MGKLSTSDKPSTPLGKLSTPAVRSFTPLGKLSTPSCKLSTPLGKLSTPSGKLSTPFGKRSTLIVNLCLLLQSGRLLLWVSCLLS